MWIFTRYCLYIKLSVDAVLIEEQQTFWTDTILIDSVSTSELYYSYYGGWYVQRLFGQSWSFRTLLDYVTLQTISDLPSIFGYIIAGLTVSILKKCLIMKKRKMISKLSWSRIGGTMTGGVFSSFVWQSNQWCLITICEINVESIQCSHWTLDQNPFFINKGFKQT